MAAYELKYTAEEIDGILESVDEKTIYGDATQSEHGLMSTADKSKLDALPTGQQIGTSLNAKVDKVTGKGLSTNDYDNTAKAKVDAIPANPKYTDTTYTAGDGISIEGNVISATGGGGGGEENVIEAITMNGASVPVTNKTAAITETDPTVPSWAKQSTKPSYNYSEIGNTPDLSDFITKSVNDLANYYLKSETYTQAEVNALIGAIQQFHYEIYASLPQNGDSNVLYLIGPTGSGSDRYEEYVYANNAFTKIGDTSIDLSGYVTTTALNNALASYTPTSNLATVATSGDYDDLTNKPTIPAAQIQSDWSQSDNTAKDFIKNKPTIPAAQVNSDWNASSGVAQILNKPTIPTVPVQDVTVGGTSVLSNGVAVVPSIPDTSGLAPKIPITNHGTSDTTFTLTPNVFHVWGQVSSLTLTLDTASTIYLDEFMFQFESGSTATTLNLPQTVKVIGTVEASKTYQCSIANNIAVLGGAS